MVTEFVFAAMNQMATPASSTEPMVRSLTSRPLTVTVGGPYSRAGFRAIRVIMGRLCDACDPRNGLPHVPSGA
ncbi:hypothetical protein GCM10010293_66380 [Streptomyces griseoflavus]|nr:hypothetical protein GCM10010293_66380 [Streptomyces griseoflavus]